MSRHWLVALRHFVGKIGPFAYSLPRTTDKQTAEMKDVQTSTLLRQVCRVHEAAAMHEAKTSSNKRKFYHILSHYPI